ncbi:MAG: hypothetical protein ABL982_26170, partial [Vicinamibacterales bacterium]
NIAYSPVLTWGNPLMTSLERQALVPMVGENPVDGADNPRRSGFVRGFSLSTQERADLLAFLQSLTDQSFLTNPRFSNPWPSHAVTAAKATGQAGH